MLTQLYVLLHLYLWHLADAIIWRNSQYNFVNKGEKVALGKIFNSDKSAVHSSLTTHIHTPAHTLDGDKLAVRSCLNAPHSPTHTYINPVPQPWTGHRLLHLSILHWDSCRMHTHVLTLLQTGWRNYFSALRFLFSPLSLSDTHTRIHTRSLSFQPEETVLAGRKNRSKSTLQLVVFRRSKCTWTRTGFKMEIQGGSGGRGVKDK